MARELEYLVEDLKGLTPTARQNRLLDLVSVRWELITVDNDLAYLRRSVHRPPVERDQRPMRVPGSTFLR